MPDGLVLLDKPAGRTSFEALSPVKRALETGKVGHAGTLDRFATGLLIVLTGKLTRLNRVFTDLEKHYTARVRFGEETDTLDPEGEVTSRGPVPGEAALREAVESFVGEIEQVPPAYSAIHVGGTRAYERVRRGETLTIEPRRVVVHGVSVRSFGDGEAVLDIRCGSGTYVRSLARDIARHLGTVAHVRELRRTAIGGFDVDEAVSPDDFVATRDVLSPFAVAERARGIGTAQLTPEAVHRVAHGQRIRGTDLSTPADDDAIVLLLTPEGRLAGGVERRDGGFRYLFVSQTE
jgi:tRNA pseudouridine55 synthase